MTSERPLRLGVAGLGRAFVLTLPSLQSDPRIELAACAAPRAFSREAFRDAFGGRAYESVDDLCADPDVEAVYIATPHQLHREHCLTALAAGKAVLLDKPLAVSLADGQAIMDAAEKFQVPLVVGPSHSFDAQVLKARDLVASGAYGLPRMIHAFNYTDFLYRPRRPEELVTDEGGGVVFSQGVHQIDIVRLLGGGLVRSVFASTGIWDGARPSECAYAAQLVFEGGCFASLTYSGFAHFDSDEWAGWVSELGADSSPDGYGRARRALRDVGTAREEADLKKKRTFGFSGNLPPARHNEHFGPLILSCDKADIRLTPDGLWIYGDEDRHFLEVPLAGAPRRTVVDVLYKAVREGVSPLQDAAWGLASLEVCHAILQSAKSGAAVSLSRQVEALSERERAG